MIALGILLLPWSQGSSPFEGKNKYIYPLMALLFVGLTYRLQAVLSLYVATSLFLIAFQQKFVSKPLYTRYKTNAGGVV